MHLILDCVNKGRLDMKTNEHLLVVNNLRVSFNTYVGKVRAVRGVNFHLKEGETLAIVGESGCGKSVTAKSIMKLLGRTNAEIDESSEVMYKGRNILNMSRSELNRLRGSEISMIFQDPMTSLNPTMTIGKQITESLLKKMGKNEAKREAIRLLKLVNIPNAEERYNNYPHQLSGGMRQRVMIAIALSCQPKILIADEPTTALDVTIQAQILDLLRELKENLNTSIIIVTHDLGVVANFADRILVMYAGQIVESGTKEEIFYNSQHPYTWALLNSVPRANTERKEKLYSLLGSPPDLLLPIEGCPFAERCEYAMRICVEEKPVLTKCSESHNVICWLQHDNAPKVQSPVNNYRGTKA